MTNLQPAMENFNGKQSKKTLDLRPKGHEKAAQQAQAEREELLAQQAAASDGHPKGMDIKPANINTGFNPVPGINSQPTGEANVFKLSPSELENPPAQATQSEAAPQTQESSDLSTPSPADKDSNSQAQEKPKKPGFFGRLFGRK